MLMTHGYPRQLSHTAVLSNWLGDILGNHGTEPGHQLRLQQTPATKAETLATDTEVPATEAETLATEVPSSRDTGN